MSYMVLARRWRPQKFADLVGQDVVVRTLKNALASGNLAHAYLLCGIRGVGKTTIARLMAMAVNCHSPSAGEPCGQCPACLGIAAGSNLDVQEMDAASHTGVDDVREILDGVRYPPSFLNTKVYIIDEAHMLSKSAFNALLKTLEEPPARVLFILATTESDKLPLTVRSRCQRFDLRSLGQVEIADYLQHVFATESVRADADAVSAIALAADGSVRDALSLAERVFAYAGEHLTLESVQMALGMIGREHVYALSGAVFAGDAAAAVQQMRKAVTAGHGPRALLMELARLWHQLACLQADEALLGPEVDAGQRQWLESNARSLTAQALDLRYQVLLHGIRDLALMDERVGAEMVMMRLCGLKAISEVEPVPAGTAVPDPAHPMPTAASAADTAAAPQPKAPRLERQAVEEPAYEAGSPPADALPLHSQSDAPARAFSGWQQAVEAFAGISPSIAAKLDHVICLEFADKLRLALDKHQQQAITASDRMAFAEWLGKEVFWESRQGQQGDSLAQEREQKARAEAIRLRQNAENDPHIQALMLGMDAQLVKVIPAGVAEESGDSE